MQNNFNIKTAPVTTVKVLKTELMILKFQFKKVKRDMTSYEQSHDKH